MKIISGKTIDLSNYKEEDLLIGNVNGSTLTIVEAE